MAQENSNSTMEMGTSDQVLVASKKKKTLTYIIGGAAMLIAIAVVVTLVVVLSGNEGAESQPIVSTTVVPTTPITTTTTTTTTTLPPEPTPAPEEDTVLDLESIINGVYSPATFNGTWATDNDVMYRNANGDLVLYDVDSNSTSLLIGNTSQLLQQSSRVTVLSPDGELVMLAHNVAPVFRYSFLARYTAVDKVSGEELSITPPGVNATEAYLQNFVWGPSGTALAFVYANNIYYQPNLTSPAEAITETGEINVIYHGIPDWVYEEEVFVSNNALWFSADGGKLAFATFNDTEVRRMKVPQYIVPGPDFQYTHHRELRYPKSGTTNPTVSVTLYDLESGAETVYNAPATLTEPILKSVQFVNNNAIAVMWTNRVQTQLSVLLCPFEGTCSQIFSYDEPNGWIDNIPLMFNPAGTSFITILPQSVNGRLFKQVVQVSQANAGALWTLANRSNMPHTVAEILKWTNDDVVWYKATHVVDTSQQHIYTVDTSRTVHCFTCNVTRSDGGACLYNEANLSQDASKIAINCAGPDIPQTLIYTTDGTHLDTWDTNEEISSILTGHMNVETVRITLPSADIQLQVPNDYLNRRNVPLLVYVYGGPDTALVTKQWNVDWGTSLVARWGIAIAHIDGRGSGLRDVDNMFAINRKLGTFEVQDQIDVTRYLQQHHSWVDANRTCIWGWSYGGYASSLALARGGNVFRCAAAVAPVVDWRFYDTIYTERYMDLPNVNTVGYAQSSLLTEEIVEAYRSKRYMLIHGSADDNVHYQHAMLFSRLLQRRDVYFQQMSYTDEDHGLVGVRPHLYHALEKFLQENML